MILVLWEMFQSLLMRCDILFDGFSVFATLPLEAKGINYKSLIELLHDSCLELALRGQYDGYGIKVQKRNMETDEG